MSTDYKGKIMYSMTQAKFNELREANGGKLPAQYANSYVYTDAEDVNLSQMRTEPIYDMYSKDNNLNKNRKTGIFSGTWNVFTIDSKYSGIRVYACFANKHTVFDCDLDLIKNGTVSEMTTTGIAKNQNTSGNNAYMLYGCNITISSSLGFSVREIFAYNGIANAYSSYASSDTTYFVYKVEGILKEPAMIYTGKELHEGNGIKIEDGVISSTFNKTMLFDWYQKFNCAGGVIPLTREQVNAYDYLQLEIQQWNSGNDGIIAKTDWFIEVREPYTLLSVEKTIYSERKAQMVTIRLSSNGSQIDLSGIVASPYGSNTVLTSDANIFIGAVWGIKL